LLRKLPICATNKFVQQVGLLDEEETYVVELVGNPLAEYHHLHSLAPPARAGVHQVQVSAPPYHQKPVFCEKTGF
jgi:hypothetical protein